MSQFLISCKESRIETNRSFYSSFIIGPFHPSESITIATALRRSLLSELPGIGIISVQIEGAAHEYSNLPGIRDSVLDILLNLREVVLKKLSKNMRPQVGYLRARGPGTIVAGDLCLPPFIQCVDPNQHIATLAEDGVLNMKFIIAEGNNYIKGKPKMVIDINQFKKRRLILKKLDQVLDPGGPKQQIKENSSYLDNYYLYFKKKLKRKPDNQDLSRAKVFLRLKPTYSGSPNSYKSSFTKMPNSKYPPFLKDPNLKGAPEEKELKNFTPPPSQLFYPTLTGSALKGIGGVRGGPNIGRTQSSNNKKLNRAIKKNSLTLNLLNVDAVFNPIINVNYIIEVNEHKVLENLFDKTNKISESLSILRTKPLLGKPSYDLSPWESLFIKPGVKFDRLGHPQGGFIYAKMLKKTISLEKDNLETKLTKSKPFLLLKSIIKAPNALFSLKQLLEYQINLEKFQYLTNKTMTFGSNPFNKECPPPQGGVGLTPGGLGVELIEGDITPNLNRVPSDQKRVKNLKKKQETLLEQFDTNTAPGGQLVAGDNNVSVQEKDIQIWSSEVKKDNVFHNNIILEVWTNGSIHPREAIYEALSYLIRLFSKLKTIKSIEPLIKSEASNIDFVTEFKNNSHNLFPLNQNSFLGNYASIPLNSSFSYQKKQTIKVKKNKQLINNKTGLNALVGVALSKEAGQLNSQIAKETLNATDISVLKIGLRPLMALKKKKIDTIGQLINCTKKELLNIPYVDNKSVVEIEKSLLKIRLNLKKLPLTPL
jgi:DNA-directed RNA polymerase alpha subunit